MRRVAGAFVAVAFAAACARSSPPAPVEYATPPITRPTNVAGNAVSVAEGDTVFAIARRQDVPVRDLIEANGLAPPYRLRVGQTLTVPAAQTHLVQPGETIYTVSRRYGLDMREVARANNIAPPYALQTGMRLKVPRQGAPQPDAPTVATAAPPPAGPKPAGPPASSGAVTIATLPPPTPGEKPQPAPPSVAEPQPAATPAPPPEGAQSARTLPPAEPAPPARSGRGFIWPVQGKLISRYGPKPGGLQNDGINIAAPRGTTVRAAEGGTVVYAGNELRGFGNLLLIRHAEGWVSAYAHNDQLLVDRGAQVKRGQAIAKVGSTGSVSEPQLHFELRQGVNAVDPLRYLVKGEGPAVSSAVSSGGGQGARPGPG
jgi:murein DD-endopeptidase MepM/ murein hydrolase activator NlpD